MISDLVQIQIQITVCSPVRFSKEINQLHPLQFNEDTAVIRCYTYMLDTSHKKELIESVP